MLRLGHPVAPEEVHPTRTVLPGPPGTVVEQGGQRAVGLVEVARGVLVQDHHVGLQPLQSPVLLRLQDLARQRQAVPRDHPGEEDGEVTGDAVRPEPRLSERGAGQELRGRAQRRIAPQHAGRQPLEEQGLLGRDPEVPERAPRVRRGEREGPGRGAGVAVPLGERQRRLPAGGHPGGEGHPGHATGGEPDALAEAGDGIEQDAGRAGEGPPVERLRVPGASPAAQEARPVGLPLHGSLGAPLLADDVKSPGRRVVGGTRTPVAEDRGALRHVLRFDEQLAEGRMGQVVGRGREHHLGVARDLNLARAVAVVRHHEPPDLHVVLRGDGDVELGADLVLPPVEGGPLDREGHQVVLGLSRRGVLRGRPHRPAAHVAQVDELAPPGRRWRRGASG